MKKKLLDVKEIPIIEIKELYESRVKKAKHILSQLKQWEEINKFERGITELKKRINSYIKFGFYTTQGYMYLRYGEYDDENFINVLKLLKITITIDGDNCIKVFF